MPHGTNTDTAFVTATGLDQIVLTTSDHVTIAVWVVLAQPISIVTTAQPTPSCQMMAPVSVQTNGVDLRLTSAIHTTEFVAPDVLNLVTTTVTDLKPQTVSTA